MRDRNLFGEIVPLKDMFVKNRTNTNKEKAKKLASTHIVPNHNIEHAIETVAFLKSMLAIHSNNVPIENILYYIGTKLTGRDIEEYAIYKSDMQFEIPNVVAREHDLLGSVYQYLMTKSVRLGKGSFYTNRNMIEDIISKLDIKKNDTILDPACGSGNLLLNSKIYNPQQIFGIDNDPIAIMCCKFNYYLKFGNNAPEPKLYCMDFVDFILSNKVHFDYVICNPPFGATLNITSLYNSTVKTEDSLTYFVEHASVLADTSLFILPESVLNVKKHTALRKWMLDNLNIEDITSYGANFSGTMFPIVTLKLSIGQSSPNFIFDGKIISKEDIKNIPFYYLRPIDKQTAIVIKKVFDKQAQSLKGCIFALGVVTGNNKTKLYDNQIPGSEPIITGKEIDPFEIATPRKFIIYDRANLQQVAPDNLYRADEKLVYKTVSRNMIFAIDNNRRLTLNSANFIIPKGLSISTKCLMALLNSRLYNLLNKVIYGENKISRTNLENLPLPNIPVEQQRQIENYIDKKDYNAIDGVINSIFGVSESIL